MLTVYMFVYNNRNLYELVEGPPKLKSTTGIPPPPPKSHLHWSEG